ncbi:MAG: hypothetical protein E6G33_15255, partial [Actinobacteria bacterium]
RAEIRCPDPACNPYLTFAALLHAGLEGIEQGYELADPMETNLYHLTAEQRRERGIISLPETLGEAIDELATSELARKALGPHIFDRYVELKRKEWECSRGAPERPRAAHPAARSRPSVDRPTASGPAARIVPHSGAFAPPPIGRPLRDSVG